MSSEAVSVAMPTETVSPRMAAERWHRAAREHLPNIDDEHDLKKLWEAVTDRINTVRGYNG